MSKVAIIGSGIGGLAAAVRLAVAGHEVIVFEAGESSGGKIAELKQDGFRFDMGPSVLTMPEYIDELFELAGENPRDHFNFEKLDPVFKYFFEDGITIRTFSDPEKLVAEFQETTSVGADQITEFLKRSKEKFDITDPVFLQRSLHQVSNYFNYPTLHGVLNFGKIEAFKTMSESNRKLFNDKKVEAIFNRYAAYNGSDPYQAPATLNVIAHIELGLGAFYPKGGMKAVTAALQDLAQRCGVEFRFNEPVQEILVQDGKVAGVKSSNGVESFDEVVSNADVLATYGKLMPSLPAPEKTLAQPKSCSAIVFYWGINKAFPKLGLHNMFLAEDQEGEFKELASGKIPSDPTLYLYVSSKQQKDDAPEGCENWFVMVTVPHNQGQDWKEAVEQIRSRALEKLARQLGQNVEEHVVFESVLDPVEIEKRTSSAFGSIYGNSSNSKFAAFLRHPNFSRKIGNLYFCGGSVHPGAGIPLCVLSGKIVAELIADRS